MSPFDALRYEFGTLAKLAKLLYLKDSAIYQWVKKNQIPLKHIKTIEQLSEGRLTPQILRPDLFRGQ